MPHPMPAPAAGHDPGNTLASTLVTSRDQAPAARVEAAGRLDTDAAGRSRRGAVEPLRLILDLDGDLRQGGRVLPVVVRAEEQLQAAG
jgi:hypothetical protein